MSPLRCYVYPEGLARFATEGYDTDDLERRCAHLTNHSLNKHSSSFDGSADLDAGAQPIRIPMPIRIRIHMPIRMPIPMPMPMLMPVHMHMHMLMHIHMHMQARSALSLPSASV